MNCRAKAYRLSVQFGGLHGSNYVLEGRSSNQGLEVRNKEGKINFENKSALRDYIYFFIYS